MKALFAVAAVGLGLMSAMGPISAQPYGGRDDGYRERGPEYRERDYEDRERGPERRERDYGDRERGPEFRERESAFDEREYLRCNPDVRQAIERGQMESAIAHYRTFGRREGRRLSC